MWNELVKRVIQKQSEQEALAEPSVMDEYIKQNDPNQWATILLARQRQNAVDAAMQGGPTVGSIKPTMSIREFYKMFPERAPVGLDKLDDFIAKEEAKTLERMATNERGKVAERLKEIPETNAGKIQKSFAQLLGSESERLPSLDEIKSKGTAPDSEGFGTLPNGNPYHISDTPVEPYTIEQLKELRKKSFKVIK